MKKSIIYILFLGALSIPVFSADLSKVFLTQVVTGDIAPAFGEACIFLVRTPDDTLLGLVNRDEDCVKLTNRFEGDQGKWIAVSSESVKPIKNKKDLKTLKESVNRYATYSHWDGMYDVYSLSFEKSKKAESRGVKQLQELGKEMVRDEIGGDAGEVRLYRGLRYSEELSLSEAVRQLLYTDAKSNAVPLEGATASDLSKTEDALEKASEDLIASEDQDSWTEFRGKLEDTLMTLFAERKRNNPNQERYKFLTGSLYADEYSTHFIATFDQETGELLVLVQGTNGG